VADIYSLYKVWGFHSSDYEECRLVGCDTMWLTANVPSLLFFPNWWWRQYIPPKHWFLQEPHGVTSQKTFLALSSPILVTLIRSSKTSAVSRVTWHNIPEESILHFKNTLVLNLSVAHTAMKTGFLIMITIFRCYILFVFKHLQHFYKNK
jgi:hypothetical protein